MPPDRLSRAEALLLSGLATASIALVLLMSVGAPPGFGPQNLAEALIGAPMAVWLCVQGAEALYFQACPSLSGATIARTREPAVFWSATAASLICSAVFALGFLRAILSLAVMR